MAYDVRPIRRGELGVLLELCREHARYENAPFEESGQQERWERALFGEDPVLWCWLALEGTEACGFITLTLEYATWSAAPFTHMDCLFVRAPHRRRGLGRTFVCRMEEFAVQHGCRSAQWQTPPDNALGIDFYEALGARSLNKVRFTYAVPNPVGSCSVDRVAAVIDELEARVPGFLADIGVRVGRDDLAAAVDDASPGEPNDLHDLVRGTLAARGVTIGEHPTGGPLAEEVLRGVRDAWREDTRHTVGAAPDAETVRTLLASEYERRALPDTSAHCYLRRRPGQPLLLLNALGLPLTIWSRLLHGDHGYQLIVPELSVCRLLEGGMTATKSAREVAGELGQLIEGLDNSGVDVLAWCNGGRIGMELLRTAGDLIGHLVLLCPTFRGGVTPSGQTSTFEDHLESMFALASSGPGRAGRVAALMRRPQPELDWSELAEEPTQLAAVLLGAPRAVLQNDMKIPMAEADSLAHYVARTRLDEALSADATGSLPGERITLICGSHDSVVANSHTVEWLTRRAPGFAHLEVSGAGHYIQDLQYGYLMHVLDRVLSERPAPRPLPARITANRCDDR